MSWKKNTFSYILWLAYTVLTGVGVLGVATSACYLLEYPTEYGLIVTGVFLVISGILVLLLHKLLEKYRFNAFWNSMHVRVVEAVLVVVLLAVGLYLRVSRMGEAVLDTSSYFEAAGIVDNRGIPQVVHGATYFYLLLLRGSFWLLGNKMLVGVGLQVILQMLSAIVFYFAVRRLSGTLAAIVMMGFCMLSPFMVQSSLTLSPSMLLFLGFAVTLCMVTYCLNKNQGSHAWYILTGILIGIVCYLDITGLLLLVFLISVLTLEREQEDHYLNSPAAVLGFGLGSAMLSFVAAILADACLSGKHFMAVLLAWCNTYRPRNGEIPFVAAASTGEFMDAVFLMGLLALGIFSFWRDKRQEKQGVWIGATGIFLLLYIHQMTSQNTGSNIWLYLFMAVLAGIALENIFVRDESIPVNEEVFEALEQMEAERELAEKQEKKINYIENPLPLPRKHVAKVMDYRLNDIKEQSDYDVSVSDDDDFDI